MKGKKNEGWNKCTPWENEMGVVSECVHSSTGQLVRRGQWTCVYWTNDWRLSAWEWVFLFVPFDELHNSLTHTKCHSLHVTFAGRSHSLSLFFSLLELCFDANCVLPWGQGNKEKQTLNLRSVSCKWPSSSEWKMRKRRMGERIKTFSRKTSDWAFVASLSSRWITLHQQLSQCE